MLQAIYGLNGIFGAVVILDVCMLPIFMYSGIRRMFHIIPPYALCYIVYVFAMVFNIVLRSEKLLLGLLIVQLMVWLISALKLPKL